MTTTKRVASPPPLTYREPGLALAALLVLLCLTTSAQAQPFGVPSSPSVGQGGTSTATARGADAVFANPANVRWSRRDPRSLSPVEFGLGFGGWLTTHEDFLTAGEASWRTLRWLQGSPNFQRTGLFLAEPQDYDPGRDLSDELLGAQALLLGLGRLHNQGDNRAHSYSESHVQAYVDDLFGVRFSSERHTGLTPEVDLDSLILSPSPEGLADALDREYGPEGPFAWLPESLTLSTGAQALANELAAARPALANLTPESDYVRAELLAFWFAAAAEEAGYDLSDPELRAAIVQIVTDTTGASIFDNPADPLGANDSVFAVRSLHIAELAVGTSHTFVEIPDEAAFRIGASLRGMLLRTRVDRFAMRTPRESYERIASNLLEGVFLPGSEQESFALTLDLGVGLTLFEQRLELGLVAKRLTEPVVEFSDGVSKRLRMQVRLGAAVEVLPQRLEFAVDLDLTANGSPLLPGHRWRSLGLGMQWLVHRWHALSEEPEPRDGLFWLRSGVTGNLLRDGEWALTLGGSLGVGSLTFHLDGVLNVSWTSARSSSSHPWLEGSSRLPLSTLPRGGALFFSFEASFGGTTGATAHPDSVFGAQT